MSRQPCTNNAFLSAIIGSDCPECGHTSLVHSIPGYSKTKNRECPLCVLEIKTEQLDELIEKYQELMDQALGRADGST